MKLKTIILFILLVTLVTESRADALSGMGEAIIFFGTICIIGLLGLIGTVMHFISPNGLTAWSCAVTGIAIGFLSVGLFMGRNASHTISVLGFIGLGITCFLFLKFIRYYQFRNNKKEH